MKITGVSVRDTDAGREITITGLVAANGELDGNEPAQLVTLLGRLDPDADEGEASRDTSAPTTRRSRRGAAESATSNASATTSENAAQPSEPSTSRRRRGSTEAASEEAPQGEPVRRRRRGGDDASAASATSTTASTEPAPSAESPRRRRTAPAAEAGISDADLAKAATEAGRVITPKGVMEILQEDHGVDKVNLIPQDQRQKFLDTLAEEVRLELAHNGQ